MFYKSHKFFMKVLIFLSVVTLTTVLANEVTNFDNYPKNIYTVGNCKLVVDQPCPDENIKFFLYTNPSSDDAQPIWIGANPGDTNITSLNFDPKQPVKIIIHGFNSDMYLGPLVQIRRQYLSKYNYNIIAMDWSPYCNGPCYPTAVYNTRHAGKCTAQLVLRLREVGIEDIHVIGFSLGAHVGNFIANNLKPYKLPRISGLDPAMPGFTFVSKNDKLDKSDADFVDVIHTNAFIQGTVETSGHVDFYMNGGIVQPGCWAERRFFACNHHRAPLYFAESITTNVGFWGWPCQNYFMYLIGQCQPKEPQIIAGDLASINSTGMHLVITGSVSPYAVGKFTGPTIEIVKINNNQRKATMKMLKSFESIAVGEIFRYNGI